MPGIVGLVTKKERAWAEPQLLKMVEALRHEPFYETGTWIDECLGVYAGWVVRKNSFAAGMPVRNERGDATLIFSGEEFPNPGLIGDLKSRGHDFNSQDASYLIHVYEEDPTFPAGLNGRFQGLLMDCTRGTATLFNDRFGMHKVYTHEAQEAIYFSAEAKAILNVRPDLRKMDGQGMAELMVGGCVLENRTIFEGIRTLPPGESWVFQNGCLTRKDTYFHAREWEGQTCLTPDAYYKELRDTFSQNLPRYFSGNERIGLALTGGLDTRMIMAWQRLPEASLPCYTFGGMYRECQDVIVAKRLAGMCQQPYQVIPVENQFLSSFSHYAERSIFLTDGCVDVSRSPDLYVQEKARQIAPVRISGTYGSEVLRGLAGFKPAKYLPGLFNPELVSQMNMSAENYNALKRGHPVSFAAFHQAPMRGVDTLEQTQVAVRSPYLDNNLVRTAYRDPDMRFARSDIFANNDVCNRVIADGNRALRDLRTDRGLAGKPGLAADVTRWMLEFGFKAEYAYDYGMPQWLARIDNLFSPLRLERLFLGRHKFAHFRIWYRRELSEYVRAMLLDSRTLSRSYLDRRSVEMIVHHHLKGDRNYTLEIHQLLTLELIHRLFVDQH